MKTLLIYPLLSVFLSSSCGNTKEASKSSNNNSTAQSETPAPVASSNDSQTTTDNSMTIKSNSPEAQNQNYRLIVSFISIGEGIDPKSREMLDTKINSWKSEKGKSIEMETVPWGREGEVDFCFSLKELTPQEQEVFVKEIKTMYKDKTLVQISENQPCVHKR